MHETSQLFYVLLPLQHIKRLVLQNKRVAVLGMPFRTRKISRLSRHGPLGPSFSGHDFLFCFTGDLNEKGSKNIAISKLPIFEFGSKRGKKSVQDKIMHRRTL